MKIMKYAIIIFFCIIPLWVFADECSQSCKLSEGGAPVLEKYIQDSENIFGKVLESLSDAESISDESTEQKRNRVMASLNSILSFGEHFGSFDFKISLPMTQEVPSMVERDYKKIEKMSEEFKRVLEQAERRGSAHVEIENICEDGSIPNCNFPLKEARFILIDMIKNNQRILFFIQSSLQDKPELVKDTRFILVEDTFMSEIGSYYNKDMLVSCSQCEGEFAERIEGKIDIISNMTMGAREGIKKWKDAWILMKWGKANPDYVETEERLLSEYMESQGGISGNQAGIVTDNLERYNEGGLSSSNPLLNSSRYAQSQITPVAKTFQEVLEEKIWNQEKIPYQEITRVDTEKKDSEEIAKTIASVYDSLVPFSIAEDTGTQEIQLRLLRMHFSLVRSANLLWKNTELAEDICNRQGTGIGKCEYK